MRLRLALGGAGADIWVSHVFDPFAGMADWLLAILAGQDASLAINEEGCFAHLDAVAGHRPDLVRLRVRMFEPEAVAMDGEVGRAALVRAVRGAVEAVWDQPDRETFRDAWHWYGYPEWREDHPDWPGPAVDWARIDAALAGSG